MSTKNLWEAAKKSTKSMLDKGHPSEVETVENAWEGGDNLENKYEWQPSNINELFSSKAWVKLSGIENLQEMEVHDEHVPPPASDFEGSGYTFEMFKKDGQDMANQIEDFKTNVEVFFDDMFDLDNLPEEAFAAADKLDKDLDQVRLDLERLMQNLRWEFSE